MQEWLNNNDILTYSTHKEGKWVIAKNIKIKAKTYKKWHPMIENLILVIWII